MTDINRSLRHPCQLARYEYTNRYGTFVAYLDRYWNWNEGRHCYEVVVTKLSGIIADSTVYDTLRNAEVAWRELTGQPLDR